MSSQVLSLCLKSQTTLRVISRKTTSYIENESTLQGRHWVELLPHLLVTFKTYLLRIHQGNFISVNKFTKAAVQTKQNHWFLANITLPAYRLDNHYIERRIIDRTHRLITYFTTMTSSHFYLSEGFVASA